MRFPGKFGSRLVITNDEASAKLMKAPPTTARPILWPDERPATTREIVESIRCRNLSELRGRRGGVRRRASEIQHLVDRRGDHRTGRRTDVPDPRIGPVVAGQLRSERPCRV